MLSRSGESGKSLGAAHAGVQVADPAGQAAVGGTFADLVHEWPDVWQTYLIVQMWNLSHRPQPSSGRGSADGEVHDSHRRTPLRQAGGCRVLRCRRDLTLGRGGAVQSRTGAAGDARRHLIEYHVVTDGACWAGTVDRRPSLGHDRTTPTALIYYCKFAS